MENHPLGVVESQFADIVWSHAPMKTGELVALCQQDLNWKRTTTYTVLKKFTQRGMFQLENGMVTALVSREAYYASQSRRFVEESFAGSLPAFIAAFTRQKTLSQEEIEQIHRMIDSAREG